MSTNTFPGDLQRVVLALWQDIGTPLSLRLAAMGKEGRWSEIARESVSPHQYHSAGAYRRDSVAVGILRKCEDIAPTTDLVADAKNLFYTIEKQNYATNQRLRPFLPEYNTYSEKDGHVRDFIVLMREKIESWIGSNPPQPRITEKLRDEPQGDFFINSEIRITVGDKGKFGPGATYADKGRFATVPDKMSTQPSLTHNAWPFLVPWSGTQWARACCDRYETVSYVRGNRFTAVAKDSTKMRGIAIEPSLNVFYQLGVGQNLKSCLKRAGLDLVHAQPKHKQAACAASIDGRFATIDLSNASDTLCWSLVKLLLPRGWFEKLDALRSPYTNVDGKEVLLEKFSSMGNGYTFELETVVFLALACAWMEGQYIHPIVGKNVLVFGDDIIIPTCADPEGFKSFLRFFGFTANPNKTFIEGPFRESCGGDYWDGRDVRPFHLKEFPNEPQGWIVLANGLRKLSVMDSCDVHSDHYTYRAWLRVLDAIPSLIRKCRGPEELGDLCIADDKKWWTTRSRGGIRYLRVWRGRAVKPLLWHHWTPNIVLATAVYSDLGHRLGRGGSVGIIPRDPLMSYKLGWVPYS